MPMSKLIDGVSIPFLTEEESIALNALQVGLSDPSDRLLCANRDDGMHQILGGALGNLIAARAKMICPFCSFEIPVAEVSPAHIEQALHAPAMVAPDAGSIHFAKGRVFEYEDVADRGGHAGVAYVMVRSLEGYVSHAERANKREAWCGPKIESVPLTFLLAVHNASPEGGAARQLVVSWLNEQRIFNPRQHWLEAVVRKEAGELEFDNSRFMNAVMRGKQETYHKLAQDRLELMAESLKLLVHFQEDENKAALEVGPGDALFEPRHLLGDVRSLKAQQQQFAMLVHALGKGSFPMLSRLIEPGIALALKSGDAGLEQAHGSLDVLE